MKTTKIFLIAAIAAVTNLTYSQSQKIVKIYFQPNDWAEHYVDSANYKPLQQYVDSAFIVLGYSSNKEPNTIKYKKMLAELKAHKIPSAENFIMCTDLIFYERTKNWQKFAETSEKYIESFANSYLELGYCVDVIAAKINDAFYLKKALEWNKRAIVLYENFDNSGLFGLDNYIILLRKLGRDEEADIQENKLMDIEQGTHRTKSSIDKYKALISTNKNANQETKGAKIFWAENVQSKVSFERNKLIENDWLSIYKYDKEKIFSSITAGVRSGKLKAYHDYLYHPESVMTIKEFNNIIVQWDSTFKTEDPNKPGVLITAPLKMEIKSDDIVQLKFNETIELDTLFYTLTKKVSSVSFIGYDRNKYGEQGNLIRLFDVKFNDLFKDH